ncbi:MAG: sialidase family protein [Chloroflexota bacterium]
MKISNSSWRLGLTVLGLLLLLAVPLMASLGQADERDADSEGRQSEQVLADVVNGPSFLPVSAPAAPAIGFAPQTRLGFTSGDQWEPAIAADRFGHVYVLYPQYKGVPGCPTCHSPTMVWQMSSDHGGTWTSPAVFYPAGASTGQWDAQIVVDPMDGQTVYAAWLQNGKSDTVVAKSTNFGESWSVVVADQTNSGTDKPILAVRGRDVYVSFNHAQKVWVAASHDGGATFNAVNVNKNGKLGWSLAGGGTVDPAGNVFFSWAGYEQNGGAKGAVNLFVGKSSDSGATWTNQVIDVSGAPPDCSAYQCGWAYLGAQMTMASDATGTLYTLWNANSVDKNPNRIYFAKSTNAGATWSAKQDVSTAPAGIGHAFPAIVAGAAGDVHISWMDARVGLLWNTYYRSSTDGGATWSSETDLSTFVAGYSYIQSNGFNFPFGDYYEMDMDEQRTVHVIWGEGLNYQGPGSIWYTKGR